MENYIGRIIEWITTEGVKIPIAIVVMYIGWKIINIVIDKSVKICIKRNMDSTLRTFLESIADISLKGILIVSIIINVWDSTTASLTALVASAGLAIGLALQGSLSNLAGGVIILFFRPFRVGDFIEIQNYSGKVESIKIFYTHLLTVDNKAITIPNGSLANGSIINYSLKEERRVDLIFQVAYESDILKVQDVLLEVAMSNDAVYKDEDKKPFIGIIKHNSSSIDFAVRLWCSKDEYWNIYYYMLREVKLSFDRENIEIPYSKLDVNMK